MAIVVVTAEAGERHFQDADTWETEFDGHEPGNLYIGKDDADVWVAQFAEGAWQFVYEVAEPDGDTPRKWYSVFDIPVGTLVEQADDDDLLYIPRQGQGWYIHPEDRTLPSQGWCLDDDDNAVGPFTEVLDK